MITPARRSFRTEGSTFPALQKLAQENAVDAQAMLRSVRQRVAAWSPLHPSLAALDAVTEATDLTAALTTNQAALGKVFPPSVREWGALQKARAATLGWVATEPATPLVLHGTIAKSERQWVLTTVAGQVLPLAEGTPFSNDGAEHFRSSWVHGVAANGPVTLKGLMTADGRFAVMSFSPGTVADFVMGRVFVDAAGDVAVKSLVGDSLQMVTITDPSLKAQLSKVPRLGIILPKAPIDVGGGVFEFNEPMLGGFWALGGRFQTPGVMLPNGNLEVPSEYASSSFKGPTEMPASMALPQGDLPPRVPNSERAFAFGSFLTDPDGKLTRFVATDVSQPLEHGFRAAGTTLDVLSSIAQIDAE